MTIATVELALAAPIRVNLLPADDAARYAETFACLADPTRVKVLHTVATSPGGMSIGEITTALGISQATSSHHVRKLAEVGFVHLDKHGTSTRVTVNEACCTGLPHMADVVMGAMVPRPCCPDDLPADVTVRELRDDDWDDVRRIYRQGIDTGTATFETDVPPVRTLDSHWLRGHRWVAETGGRVVGWAAATTASSRSPFAGVAETSVYVDDAHRGRGAGKALLHRQVTAADCDDNLWTLQASVFVQNRVGIAVHHQAGYRTVGIRERIAQRDGAWHDIVLLERRAGSAGSCATC